MCPCARALVLLTVVTARRRKQAKKISLDLKRKYADTWDHWKARMRKAERVIEELELREGKCAFDDDGRLRSAKEQVQQCRREARCSAQQSSRPPAKPRSRPAARPCPSDRPVTSPPSCEPAQPRPVARPHPSAPQLEPCLRKGPSNNPVKKVRFA